MRNILLIAVLVLSASSLFAQDQAYISFSYDNEGNRIRREVKTVFIPPFVNPLNQSPKDTTIIDEKVEPKPVEDAMGEDRITVYPNPTRGNLSVEITSNSTDVTSEITVFTLMGQQIFRSNSSESRVEVDITDKPAGTYIMRVGRGNLVSTWKIIKE